VLAHPLQRSFAPRSPVDLPRDIFAEIVLRFVIDRLKMGLVSDREGGVPMKVEDLIRARTEVFSVTEEITVHEVARYLREKQVRSVGVLSPGGKLVGVVSQSDISDKTAAENKCPAWMRVSEIMSPEPITIPPDTHLDECVRLMERHGIYHLAVVDEPGKYRGMISVQDLLRVIASDEKARADMLESFLFSQR
jgi:CBS domain-containing protein